MNRLKSALSALALCAALASTQAKAVFLESPDAVKLDKAGQWNVKGVEASNTTYQLVSKSGAAFSGSNYGLIDIGGTTRKISKSPTLTQGACTIWGSSGTHDVYLYAGYSSTLGVQMCVSDVANKTTVGATTTGNTGFVSCSAALASGDSIRQIGKADLNCTGPVIGTYSEAAVGTSDKQRLPVKAYGTATSTTTGSASLVFSVQNLESTDDCVVTPVSWGTGPVYMKSAAVTANTITVVGDASQSGGSTVINYLCW